MTTFLLWWSPLVGCARNELGEVEFEPVEGIESKDPESFGAWTSFDTSPDGTRLTMSYYDRLKGGVGYAVGTPDADGSFVWIHEPVDGYVGDNGLDSGDRGKYTAQRTAPDGTVWVAYQDATNGVLRVGHRKGPGNWDETVAVDGAGTGFWNTMAIDGDGNPLIVYCTDDGTVREARWDGVDWKKKDLYTSPGGAVENTTLVVEGGKEFVAFRDAAAGHLHLLVDGKDELVDADGDTGAWPSLWVKGPERRIAYHDVANQDLKYATTDGGQWAIETVDDGELRGADTALRDKGGKPEILYFDGFDNDLRIARKDGSAWTTERLAGDEIAAGFHNRVVTLGTNTWWASFDYTNSTLLMGRL